MCKKRKQKQTNKKVKLIVMILLILKKSNFIIFKSHKKRLKRQSHLQLSGNELKRVEESKFLGDVVDQHLTWKNHIEYITKKL